MKAKSLLFALVAIHFLLADPVPVRHPVGLLRGFLVLRTERGELIATGNLFQTVSGPQVTNILRFHFKDGSIHEETSVFTQQRNFRLLNYHLVQKGPAFKRPTEMRLNASTGQVSIRYIEGGKEKSIEERMKKLPNDLANGLVPTLANDIDHKAAKTTLSLVVSTPEPRLVKLEISPAGENSFSIGGATHKAIRYVAKIDLGGITGVIAPIIGMQPPDTYIWIVGGDAPGFLKSEGAMCQDCPIWRIELASPEWSAPRAPAPKTDSQQ